MVVHRLATSFAGAFGYECASRLLKAADSQAADYGVRCCTQALASRAPTAPLLIHLIATDQRNEQHNGDA